MGAGARGSLMGMKLLERERRHNMIINGRKGGMGKADACLN